MHKLRHQPLSGFSIFALAFSLLSPNLMAKEFQVEGSDLLMGVGAQAIALGGAVTAKTRSIYAVYWNPAGLVESDDSQLSIGKQLNAQILDANFAGISINSPLLQFTHYKSAIAFAWIPRLHVKASGAYNNDDLESVFLRFALPGLPSNFDGDIESKTKDYRLSWAITPRSEARWSAAFTLTRINCATSFCGVTANDPGNYHVSSANATAYGINLGGKYFLSSTLTLGANIKDLNSTLAVDYVDTNQQGVSARKIYHAKLPRDITAGLSWRRSPRWEISADYQYLSGHYGSYAMDFHLLRVGAEYSHPRLFYRMGMVVPLVLNVSSIGNLASELPAPFMPTLGVGTTLFHFSLDAALYPLPVMSYQKQSIQPALDVSLTYHF